VAEEYCWAITQAAEFEFQLNSIVYPINCIRPCVCLLKSDLPKIRVATDLPERIYYVSRGVFVYIIDLQVYIEGLLCKMWKGTRLASGFLESSKKFII
jgi:hypothetical protein